MAILTFAQMVETAQSYPPVRIAVAAAADPEVLTAVADALAVGIAEPILVGDAAGIQRIQRELGLDLRRATILDEPEPKRAAVAVVSLVAQGEADVVVKGQLKTEDLLSVALRREGGIRDRKLLTHVGIFEMARCDRLIYVSDSGVVLYPDIHQKLEIIQNVVSVAHCFGLDCPKVAILSSTEDVDPSLPGGVDGLILSRMAQQGAVEEALVEGPLSLDVAISQHAAQAKGCAGPVAGQADILIVPSVEAGNIMAKSIQYFAHGRMAGLVVGARAPILISSRADVAETRFLSLAMAAIMVNFRRRQE